MSWCYRHLVRPVLFTQNAEQVHDRTMRLLAWTSRHDWATGLLSSIFGGPPAPIELFGLNFPNPVGLAAGMDKRAIAVPVWQALGFGFSELGGVTWHPQPGNPEPRIFRSVADRAIINRMGFNNPGAEAIAQTLAQWRGSGLWPNHPVGINLGKSKITPLESAAGDYAGSFRLLRSHADFFVVNVSSPNTPNLRKLQDKEALDSILAAIQLEQPKEAGSAQLPGGGQGTSSQISAREGSRPILIKVAPDLSFEALDEILELVSPRNVAGIIATNTTITRPETSDPVRQKLYAEPGGLSGGPLRQRSTEIIRHLHLQTRGKVPIIGVGGIFDAADAWEKITAGASLVQIYTGLVYEGPGMVRGIIRGLLKRVEAAGLSRISQAVGIAVK